MQPTITSAQGKLVLVATIAASGITFLFGTAITVALPTIQHALDASLADVQWLLNAYTLTLSVLILISGSLSDRFGRKRLFLYGIGLFALGALLSGFAQNISQLITFQVVQGIGAAMMIPGSLSIINVYFPKEERGQAIGLWSGLSAGIGAFGPVLGGFLVEALSWRAIFFITVPLALAALWITTRYVKESRGVTRGAIDMWGTITIGVALFAFTFGLVRAGIAGFQDTIVLGALAGSIVAFILFVLAERRTENPIVPFSMFKNPLVAGANVVTLFLYFALFGVFFFITLNFQQVQNYSPLLAGFGMLPPILLITFFSGMAGKLSDRIGPRLPMAGGAAIVTIGLLTFILAGTQANYFISFLPGLILFGIGMTLVVPALTKSALSVPEEYSGAASGVNNAVARVASLLAVAILGVVAATSFAAYLPDRLAQSELTESDRNSIAIQAEKLAGIELSDISTDEAREEAQVIISETFVSSFRILMLMSAALAFISAILAFYMTRPRPQLGN